MTAPVKQRPRPAAPVSRTASRDLRTTTDAQNTWNWRSEDLGTLSDSDRLSSEPAEHNAKLPGPSSAIDLILLLVCFTGVHVAHHGDLNLTSERFTALLFAVFIVPLGLTAAGLYRRDFAHGLFAQVARLSVVCGLALGAIALLAYFTKTGDDVSRLWIGGSMLLTALALIGARFVFLWTQQLTGRSSLLKERVMLLAPAPRAKVIQRSVAMSRSSSAEIIESLERTSDRDDDVYIQEAVNYVERCRESGNPVTQVWLGFASSDSAFMQRITYALIDSSVDICIVPDAYGAQLLRGSVTRVGQHSVVNVSDIRLPHEAELFKRIFDVCFSLSALVVTAPLMLIIACLVRLETPGPALFRQPRYGRDGRVIEVWKFRSMRLHQADREVKQATRGDSRVTRVGRVIRATSLDELPQFFNVLQGHMSIVGPRPHEVSHNESWRQQINGYMLRHKIKPGITGWAQVNGARGETDTIDKMQRRVRLDLEYIEHWSPLLDVRIVVATVAQIFFPKNDVY